MMWIFGIISFIVIWYIITDTVGSKEVIYSYPQICCRCGSTAVWKNWNIKRSWFFGGSEVIDQFFPVAQREAQVPLCENCFCKVQANKAKAESISKWIAASAYFPITYSLYRLFNPMTVCKNHFLGLVWCHGLIITGSFIIGLICAALVYLCIPRIVEISFNLLPPPDSIYLGRSNLLIQHTMRFFRR